MRQESSCSRGNRSTAALCLAVICAIALSACPKKEPESTSYQVGGSLETRNTNCDGALPAQVIVHAEVFKGNDSVGKSGTFAANGPYNLTIEWPQSKGAPDGWRVTRVERPDGTDLCEHPDMACAAPKRCLDMATKVRRAPIGTPIDWRVNCTCVG